MEGFIVNRSEIIREVLNIRKEDYRYGVAKTNVDRVELNELVLAGLFDLEQSHHEGPKNKEFYDFINKYEDRDIELQLLVIDPRRDDFRICVCGIRTKTEYMDINTPEDKEFFKSFVGLTTKGHSNLHETKDTVAYYWYD